MVYHRQTPFIQATCSSNLDIFFTFFSFLTTILKHFFRKNQTFLPHFSKAKTRFSNKVRSTACRAHRSEGALVEGPSSFPDVGKTMPYLPSPSHHQFLVGGMVYPYILEYPIVSEINFSIFLGMISQ